MDSPSDRAVPVLVEPQDGHSDEEVAAALESCGATSVEILEPGFISARAPLRALTELASLAQFHRKPRKRMRPHRRVK